MKKSVQNFNLPNAKYNALTVFRYGLFGFVVALLVGCGGGQAAELPTVFAPTELPTLVPTMTLPATPIPTLQASITPGPSPTFPPTAVPLDPLTSGEDIPPPLNITLPQDWQVAYDGLVFEDIAELRILPFAYYRGPIEGGTGNIVVLWGFPATMGNNPLTPRQPNLYVDGLRYLRLAIMESGCNIGTDMQYDYTVGGLPAVGTQFSAVTCPSTPDTRGWFAGVNVEGVNFIFYMYTDPIFAMDGRAPEAFRAVLDSVQFRVTEYLAGEWPPQTTP